MVDRMDVMVTMSSSTPGGKDFWYKIGTAFPQRNGTGWSIELAALPIPADGRCRLLLMPPREGPSQRGGGGGWQQRPAPGVGRPQQTPMPIEPLPGDEEPAPW